MAPKKKSMLNKCVHVPINTYTNVYYGEKTSLKTCHERPMSHIHALTASWGLRWYTALHHWYKPTSTGKSFFVRPTVKGGAGTQVRETRVGKIMGNLGGPPTQCHALEDEPVKIRIDYNTSYGILVVNITPLMGP